MRVVGRRFSAWIWSISSLSSRRFFPFTSENCARRALVIFSTFSFRWASSNFWTAFCFMRMGWRARAPPRHTEGDQQAARSAPGNNEHASPLARAPLSRW